jgi:biopolymer transport protein ExbD
MRMRSPIPHKKARIEIIPLIDIMFFLLASFMMVSLSQTHMKGIPVNLPSANSPPPPPNEKKDYVSIRVTEGGLVYFDNAPVLDSDVLPKLYQLHEGNKDVKVSLSAETLAMHGDVIGLLDKVRLAGITKIGYQIKAASVTGSAGTVPPPGPPGAPPPPPNKP